jgi:hypothetical protein
VLDSAEYADCVQKLLDDFRSYDSTVDIVSCWQFFFCEVQPLAKNILHFDRFPRLVAATEHDESLRTPEFAVLISDSYGLVADVKRGFPLDDKDFLAHAKRPLKYDVPLSLKAGIAGASIVPTDHDILLIIPWRDSQQIVGRLEKKRNDGSLGGARSLIVFEWLWDGDRNEYVFRKVAGQSCDFRDGSMPPGLRLSSYFTEGGSSLKVSAEKMAPIKAIWQFCNDSPPPIYMLVFLWTKVFYHLLNSSQRQSWQRRDPRKIIWLETTTASIVKEIENRYALRWGHWTDWVRNALDVLVKAGLAKRSEKEQYAVGYRNLVRELGKPSHFPREGEPAFHPREYARILATYICRGSEASGGQQPTNSPEGPQRSLFS